MLRLAGFLTALCLLAGCGGTGIYVLHGSGEDRRSPLEKAAQEGNSTEVQRLLASGGNPNDRSGVYGSPLNAATWRQGNVAVIHILLAAGADPNGRAEERGMCWAPPLWNAASQGDLENTRALLDAGASLRTSKCSTLALGWLKKPILELLVQHGLSLNEADDKGRNALHLALAPPLVAPPEGIEYLVHAGVPLNARDHSGKTPLAYWREPRDYEARSFSTWLFTRVFDDSFVEARKNRPIISAFLERSGALP